MGADHLGVGGDGLHSVRCSNRYAQPDPGAADVNSGSGRNPSCCKQSSGHSDGSAADAHRTRDAASRDACSAGRDACSTDSDTCSADSHRDRAAADKYTDTAADCNVCSAAADAGPADGDPGSADRYAGDDCGGAGANRDPVSAAV